MSSLFVLFITSINQPDQDFKQEQEQKHPNFLMILNCPVLQFMMTQSINEYVFQNFVYKDIDDRGPFS